MKERSRDLNVKRRVYRRLRSRLMHSCQWGNEINKERLKVKRTIDAGKQKCSAGQVAFKKTETQITEKYPMNVH